MASGMSSANIYRHDRMQKLLNRNVIRVRSMGTRRGSLAPYCNGDIEILGIDVIYKTLFLIYKATCLEFNLHSRTQ